MKCQGVETHLADCESLGWANNQNCDANLNYVAGVVCNGRSINMIFYAKDYLTSESYVKRPLLFDLIDLISFIYFCLIFFFFCIFTNI